MTHFKFVSIMKAENTVSSWAKSTEDKITDYFDEYLINFPQSNVRKSSKKLLYSLFRKGNQTQKSRIFQLIRVRLQLLTSMGRSSEQFLELISQIFSGYATSFEDERKEITLSILKHAKTIFKKIIAHPEYEFYALCANMIDFSGEFKPYLLEANGCLKCFGRPDCDFENLPINSVKDQLRVHLNYVEFVLKRKYEIKNLKLTYGKKKINFKSVIVSYRDEAGEKKEVGKYSITDNIPLLSMTTNSIIISFQLGKVRRNQQLLCLGCSSNEEYSCICTNCFGKFLEIEGSFKVVGGDPTRISKQLCQSYKNLNKYRKELEDFSICVKQKSKVSMPKPKVISDMSANYLYIIQNLRLMRQVSEKQLAEQKKELRCVTDCYSCHFYEFSSIIEFVSKLLHNSSIPLTLSQLSGIITDFNEYFKWNQVQSIKEDISEILGSLILMLNDAKYLESIKIDCNNHSQMTKLLSNLIIQIKEKQTKEQGQGKDASILENFYSNVKALILNQNINKELSLSDRLLLFNVCNLSEEESWFLNQADLTFEKLNDLKRISLNQYYEYKTLINFDPTAVILSDISNSARVFLKILPQELIPVSNLQIKDAQFLKYTKNVIPEITDEFINENLVFSPNPILKLNIFKILPELIKTLPLQDSMTLITRLCKFKDYWNLNIKETIDNFDKLLSQIDKEKKLYLSIEGFDKSKENMYFQNIFKILTPQRPNFIIRLDTPDIQMQKQQKLRGGPVQYIYLPIRQVKSEDLRGDTIGALHEWVTLQLKKMNQDMPFDLIVEKNIIDNLDLSLEIVYRKIVQKQAKKTIGNKSYDFFKVIYRIQGIFGEANESVSGRPRDQKLEECITYSSHLLTKIQNNKKRCGLDVLIEILPTLKKTPQDKARREKVFKILEIIFKNSTIIQKIVEWQYSDYILNLTVKFLSLSKSDLKNTQTLLEMCSKLIDEANNEMTYIRKKSYSGRKDSQFLMLDETQGSIECEKSVRFVLEKVKEAEESSMKDISKKLIKILPYCSKDDYNTSKYLFQFFEMKKFLELKYSQKINWMMEFVQALSENFTSFKTICRQSGVTEEIVTNIVNHIQTFENSTEPKNYNQIENIEVSLTILKGLIQGDEILQESLYQKGIIQKIYDISCIKTSDLTEKDHMKYGKVPQICFLIIKYLLEGKMINKKIAQHFQNKQDTKKKQLLLKKQQKKKEVKARKSELMKLLKQNLPEQQKQTDLVICSSCKEGYRTKKQVLGFYLHSSKYEIHPLDSWWKDNKKINSFTSTSYFTAIHYECHLNALKDDQKIQKSEWDGALIRNSDVLCNNWIAVKGPQTTDEEFQKVHRKYFQRNGKSGGFWIVINDLNGLLERFSKQYNFSQETKGSSFTHNSKLIVILIAYASHLLKNSDEIKYLREGSAHIEEFLTKKHNLLNLFFCISIFLNKYETFQKKKPLYWKMIEHLSFPSFKEQKSHLIFFSMVNEIVKHTNKSIQDDKNVAQQLNVLIPQQLNELIPVFQKIGDMYKNEFLKWETIEDFKKYLQL